MPDPAPAPSGQQHVVYYRGPSGPGSGLGPDHVPFPPHDAVTDMAIVRKVNADVADILAQPEMQAFLAEQGAQVLVSQPQVFLDRLRANVAMWAKTVADVIATTGALLLW